MESLAKAEPLAELIKTKLRPVQERVASLRTQTHLYEEMEQIPGGPKQFMSSTLAELDRITNTDILELEIEVPLLLLPSLMLIYK
jgi:hypothetical protein